MSKQLLMGLATGGAVTWLLCCATRKPCPCEATESMQAAVVNYWTGDIYTVGDDREILGIAQNIAREHRQNVVVHRADGPVIVGPRGGVRSPNKTERANMNGMAGLREHPLGLASLNHPRTLTQGDLEVLAYHTSTYS